LQALASNARSIILLAALQNTAAATPLESDLMLKPPVACKGAGRPAPRTKETIHAETVGALATAMDLNGDGWCDWVMAVAYPTDTQLSEHSAKEAILLGTEKGARTFGNVDKLKLHWKQQLPVPDGLVLPSGVTEWRRCWWPSPVRPRRLILSGFPAPTPTIGPMRRQARLSHFRVGSLIPIDVSERNRSKL